MSWSAVYSMVEHMPSYLILACHQDKGANLKWTNKINIKIPGARLEPLTLDRKMDVVQEYENKVSASEWLSVFPT